MRSLFFALMTTLVVATSSAADKVAMAFKDEDISKIIDVYSKAAKQKFVIDSSVRGKTTILLPEPVTIDEAFNQLSSALAVNGYAISTQGDTMIVKPARNIARDLITVTSEQLPALKPERMVTWVYQAKNLSAEQINRELRMLTSKDGEMNITGWSNQIVLTDWISNLHRVEAILRAVDISPTPNIAKIIEKANHEAKRLKKTNP